LPELGCYGHKEYSAGVRNYGKRDPKELFDVYCFAKELDGTSRYTQNTNTHAHETHQNLSLLLASTLMFASYSAAILKDKSWDICIIFLLQIE